MATNPRSSTRKAAQFARRALKRRMFWFSADDDRALTDLMRLYRCQTKSQAVRLALSLAVSGRVADVSRRELDALDRRNPGAKDDPALNHVLTQLLRLAEAQPIDAGLNLPEDLSERLDDYLYADLRRGLADVNEGGVENR